MSLSILKRTKLNMLFTPSSSRRLLMLFFVAFLMLSIAVAWRMANPLVPQTSAPTAPIELASTEAILQMEGRIERNPEDVQAYALLGRGLLQQVRETGDSSLYEQAEAAFEQALSLDPENLDALIGQGILAAARHDFATALSWANTAHDLNPWRAETLGIIVDANIELGRYEEAIAATQEMVDLRPGLDSYSRVSYVRELYGDTKGAMAAMQSAVEAGMPDTEPWRWATVQLGNLYLGQGEIDTAEQHYVQVLESQPNYVHALLSMADVAMARGDLDTAEATLESIVERLPFPEFIIPLGDLYAAQDKPELAAEQYAAAQEQLDASLVEGKILDHEIAEFTLAHGDPETALAHAQTVYEQGPTIFAAETLAMAHLQLGNHDNAWEIIQEGLRLGTHDFHLHWYAGVIAHERGETEVAEDYLEKAIVINPIELNPERMEAKALLDEIKQQL